MENFVFYKTWYEIIEDEPQEVQWEIIYAVMEYAFKDNLVELKPKSKMAFKFIKRDIDRAKESYSQFIDKQRENGKKGGRPPKTQENPENPSLFLETQKSHKEKISKEKKREEKEDSDFVNIRGINFPSSHVNHSDAFLKNKIVLEAFMMQQKIKHEDFVRKYLFEFLLHLNTEEKVYSGNDEKEFSKHFKSWFRKVPRITELKPQPNASGKAWLM